MFHETSFLVYLEHERRLSPHTVTAYRTDIGQFLDYVREKQCLTSVTEVRHSHIRAWTVHQMQGGAEARSVNRRLSCLKTYFKFLKKNGHLTDDPMRKVTGPRQGKRLPVTIRENEVSVLFGNTAFPKGYTGILHRTVLELLYGAGLRRGELAALSTGDYDRSRRVLQVKGKGSKARLIPVVPYLAQILEDFLEARSRHFPETDAIAFFLHPSGQALTVDHIYYFVKKYLTAATYAPQASPHVLRHAFATHLSNRGADLNAIKMLLGHASLAATQVYMHNNIERLKAVYQLAHPQADTREEKQEDKEG